MFRALIGMEEFPPGSEEQVLTMVTWIYAGVAVMAAIFGIFGIIGGIYATQRRYWGLGLTAAILGTVNFCPTGIPAIIFIAMGKSEFEVTVTDADVTSI